MKRHLSIGMIIAIVLLVYWWIKDHPQATQPPATQGYNTLWMAA